MKKVIEGVKIKSVNHKNIVKCINNFKIDNSGKKSM